MIKLEALEDFTLSRFNEVKNIIRKDKDEKGKIFYEDIFVCEKDLAEYLTNTGKEPNPANRAVARIIEVIPEIKEVVKEEKEVKKPVRRKTTKRK